MANLDFFKNVLNTPVHNREAAHMKIMLNHLFSISLTA